LALCYTKKCTSFSSTAVVDGAILTSSVRPGWLVEGIPDYIRWFQYEPQSHGADASLFRARAQSPAEL
jgi:hypothetical protein